MFKTVFSDDAILVLDKPANLVVTKSDTQVDGTLEDILKSEFGIKIDRGGIVHRLDKDTSGLIVVAKTVEALEKLQAQFKERTVKKEYLALVHGYVTKGGVINAPILRNPGNREKFMVLQKMSTSEEPKLTSEVSAREAVTEYEPVQRLAFSEQRLVEIFSGFNKIQFRKLYAIRYPLFTLLKCHPLTGRTHQIRVHLKYAGHAIVSDEKYGGRKMVRLDKRFCPRQFLHAAKLEFTHPVTGERMNFNSKLPEDLKGVLKKLEIV